MLRLRPALAKLKALSRVHCGVRRVRCMHATARLLCTRPRICVWLVSGECVKKREDGRLLVERGV